MMGGEAAAAAVAHHHDAPFRPVIQPDFDLVGGADLRAALMSGGLDPHLGVAGLPTEDMPPIVFMAINRHHPALVKRLEELTVLIPRSSCCMVTGVSGPDVDASQHSEAQDDILDMLKVAGIKFLKLAERRYDSRIGCKATFRRHSKRVFSILR